MQTRTKIKAVIREKDAAGKFQTNLTPNDTFKGKNLIRRWADYSRLNLAQAEVTLTLLRGFILDELAKGNKLDFELVSFYPRLSAALPNRDSSPDAEGLYVRGAVKARRPLMNELKDKLEAVNDLSSVHSHIFNVFDKTAQRFDVLAAGHLLQHFLVQLQHVVLHVLIHHDDLLPFRWRQRRGSFLDSFSPV